MEEFVLARNLAEALSEAKTRLPPLSSNHAKLRPVFESFALSIGLTDSKLRVLDICDEGGDVSKRLSHFIYHIYPANEIYRGQINSRVKYLIRALTGADPKEVEAGTFSLLTGDLPEYMLPLLRVLPRDVPQGHLRQNRHHAETRLQYRLSRNGLQLLSGCLDVHKQYRITSLKELLCEHSVHIIKACEKLFGKAVRNRLAPRISGLRRQLGLRLNATHPISLVKEKWPPTLRREWEVYAKKAINDNSGDMELAEAEAFGFELNEVKSSTIEQREKLMGAALGHILPHARSLGIIDFGVGDLLRIEHGVINLNGKEVPNDFNPLVEFFCQHERARFSDRKRNNRDSVTFCRLLTTVRRIGIYNGKAHLVEAFSRAYSKRRLDRGTKEARKARRLATYPCSLIDRKIELLEPAFDGIIKTGAFKREVGERNLDEANANFSFCVYYIALLVLRFLGYRQQCLRYCRLNENIIFNKDGSITLFWPKGRIKNKKTIRVVLDAKKRPYQKRLVRILWAYYRKVYPYANEFNARCGNLGLSNNQFFLHINIHNEYTYFPEGDRGATMLYLWWTRLSEKYMKFDELGVSNRVPFNPHFLRALCINWMKDDLGLSDDDIAEAVGDTVEVVRAAYISRERVYDATPITDKIADRYREREEKELGLQERLKQIDEEHKAEVLRLRQEAENWKQVAHRFEKSSVPLEAEVSYLRAANQKLSETVQDQADLIFELTSRIDRLNSSGDEVKKRRVKIA